MFALTFNFRSDGQPRSSRLYTLGQNFLQKSLLFEALDMYFTDVSPMVLKYLDDFFLGYITPVLGDAVVVVFQPRILILVFSGQETPLVRWFEQVD